MARKPFIRITIDRVPHVKGAIEQLASTKLMVGIPGSKTTREKGEPITNAEILYIQEHGAPEVNIPAREVMRPVILDQKAMISDEFRKAGIAAFKGQQDTAETILGQLGQEIADLFRARIQGHIPPPLSPKTVLRRTTRLAAYKNASRKKRAQMRAEATTPEAIADATPLLDTGQLSHALTWVLRKVRR